MNPTGEAAERISKTIPALAAAAKAIGLQDHRRMLNAAANRVDDSHKAGMKQLGFDVETNGDDMAGDIFICGDITGGDPSRVIDSLNGNAKCDTPATKPIAKTKRLSGVAGAALFAIGAATGSVPLMIGALKPTVEKMTTQTEQTPETTGDSVSIEIDGTKYGLQLWKPNE